MAVATGRGRSTAANNVSESPSSTNTGSNFGGGSRNTSSKSNKPKGRYSKADVKRITAMGFAEDVAINALLSNNSNVEEAIDSLVGGNY